MFTHPLTPDAELRPLEMRYAQEIFASIEQNRTYLRRWLSWVDDNTSVEDTRAFIHSGLLQVAEGNGGHAGIWYRGQLAGLIGMLPVQWENRQVEIGYWLAEAYQGKGLMTMACRAMIEYIFTERELHRVVIRALTENVRSRAIPERLGFTHEGTQREAEYLHGHFRNMEVYSLLRQEWQGGAPSA